MQNIIYCVIICQVILLDRWHMSVEQNVELGMLLDLYGSFLSKKQFDITSSYVNSNLSLGEIAEQYNISRSAVLDALNTSKRKLYDYESKLKLYSLKKSLESAVKLDDEMCKNQIKKILEEF